MFIIKRNYYLYIENTESIDLNCIKKSKKISIIYRNNKVQESAEKLHRFKKLCNIRGFKLYISNNIKLLRDCKADGLYISSFNKKIYLNKNFDLIGSAHSSREINEKIKQGCKTIFLSRLFETSYSDKKGHLGLVKFNLLSSKYRITIVPLGGIKSSNLNKLNLVNGNSLALFSEVKKKPVISNRLF
jgi:thiamine-phosphate pyrophosphorylase